MGDNPSHGRTRKTAQSSTSLHSRPSAAIDRRRHHKSKSSGRRAVDGFKRKYSCERLARSSPFRFRSFKAALSTQSDPFLSASQRPLVPQSLLPSAADRPIVISVAVAVETATSNRYQRAKVVNVWNVPFDQVTMSSALDGIAAMVADRKRRYVITANLKYEMLAAEDRLPCRVAGSEMISRLAEKAAQNGWRIYFLGAEPGVAQACADNLAARYPGMIIAGVHSPPYRKLTSAEIEQQFSDIRTAKPDILLVAFGQPKGEKWIAEHYQSLGVPVSIQVGASFDFAAGRIERAPLWVQKIGFEWAHRTLGDPKRLLPRYYRNFRFLAVSLTRQWIDFANRRFGEHPPVENEVPLVDRRKTM